MSEIMAADLLALTEDLPTPSDLVIEQVNDNETLKKWCNAATTGFGMADFCFRRFLRFL